MNKYYIIIPTKNRIDTLFSALETARQQEYSNLEIIVSDNSDHDQIKQQLDKLSDPRIKYFQTQNKCMMNSWEFALSQISEPGFVHIMGDDNGLTPSAIRYVDSLIKRTNLKIVLSEHIEYQWPDSQDFSEITIPLKKDYIIANSRLALKNAFKMRRGFGFNLLPTINSSFVHTSVIDRAKAISDGRYFCASNPDVYSAVINAACTRQYVYSKLPFVINGASKHSNGSNSGKGLSNFAEDNLQDGYKYHYPYPPSKSYYLNVYEAFFAAQDKINLYNLDFKFQLDHQKVLNRMIHFEYAKKQKYWLKDDIILFAKNIGCTQELPSLDQIDIKNKARSECKYFFPNTEFKKTCRETIRNVLEASLLSSDILSGVSNYDKSSRNNFGFCLLYIKRLVRNKIREYYLGSYMHIWDKYKCRLKRI